LRPSSGLRRRQPVGIEGRPTAYGNSRSLHTYIAVGRVPVVDQRPWRKPAEGDRCRSKMVRDPTSFFHRSRHFYGSERAAQIRNLVDPQWALQVFARKTEQCESRPLSEMHLTVRPKAIHLLDCAYEGDSLQSARGPDQDTSSVHGPCATTMSRWDICLRSSTTQKPILKKRSTIPNASRCRR